jgi:hypothetical protein
MATSGTIDETMTARQVCTAAAQDLGVYGAGESVSASDMAEMVRRLSFMLKSWQADGVNLWREADGEVEFLAGEKTVTLYPYCLDVLEARLVQSSTFLRPLQRWELGEYKQLPNPDQPGIPAAFYVGKGTGAVALSLWPVPQSDVTIRYTYSRVIEDVTDANQNLDVPQEWLEAVWTNLAVRCASMFGAARLDPAGLQLLIGRAATLEQKMLDQDRPASIFMGPVYGRYFLWPIRSGSQWGREGGGSRRAGLWLGQRWFCDGAALFRPSDQRRRSKRRCHLSSDSRRLHRLRHTD